MSSWALSRERTPKSFPSQAQFPESPQSPVPTSLWMCCAADPTSSRPSAGLPRRTNESVLRFRTTTRRFRFPARLVSTAPAEALFSTGKRSSPSGRERCDGGSSSLVRSQPKSRNRAARMPKRLDRKSVGRERVEGEGGGGGTRGEEGK